MEPLRERVARLIAKWACTTDAWEDYLPKADAILQAVEEDRAASLREWGDAMQRADEEEAGRLKMWDIAKHEQVRAEKAEARWEAACADIAKAEAREAKLVNLLRVAMPNRSTMPIEDVPKWWAEVNAALAVKEGK